MAVDLGDVIRLNFTNLSPAEAPVTAGTMGVTITLPDLTTTVVSPITADTTGVYHYDYQTTQSGRHIVRWLGTGANPGSHSEAFDVRSATPLYLVSVADIKQQLNMTGSDDDEELRIYVEGATYLIEDYLGRAVIRRSFTEEHTVCGDMMLNWTPVQSLTSVTTPDGLITWNIGDLHVSPSGVVTAKAGAAILNGNITVTYVAGSSVVPANWSLAARIIVQDLWQTQRGSAGAPFAGGLDMPGAGFTGYGYAMPVKVKQLLTGRLTGV